MKELIVPDRFDEVEEEREIDRDIEEMENEPLPDKGVVFDSNWWHGVGSPDKHYWWKDIK